MNAPSTSVLNGLPFACPLDGLPLTAGAGALACPKGHSYDISARGYINLLPVQFKKSRDPGDSKSMVAARRRVLSAGLFDPLAAALCEIVNKALETTGGDQPLLVDAGCGEGFYTARMGAFFHERTRSSATQVLGVDISKWAVTTAAKRSRDIAWVVASNKRLPLLPGTVSGITSLFGFETWPDWAALQSSGQFVTVVHAGPRHLIELREIIYPSLQLHEPPGHESAAASGYKLTEDSACRFEQESLNADVLMDLLEMTPHGRKSTREARDRLRSAAGLSLTFDTVIRTYRRG